MALIKCFATQLILSEVYKKVHKRKINKYESIFAKPLSYKAEESTFKPTPIVLLKEIFFI